MAYQTWENISNRRKLVDLVDQHAELLSELRFIEQQLGINEFEAQPQNTHWTTAKSQIDNQTHANRRSRAKKHLPSPLETIPEHPNAQTPSHPTTRQRTPHPLNAYPFPVSTPTFATLHKLYTYTNTVTLALLLFLLALLALKTYNHHYPSPSAVQPLIAHRLRLIDRFPRVPTISPGLTPIPGLYHRHWPFPPSSPAPSPTSIVSTRPPVSASTTTVPTPSPSPNPASTLSTTPSPSPTAAALLSAQNVISGLLIAAAGPLVLEPGRRALRILFRLVGGERRMQGRLVETLKRWWEAIKWVD